MSRTHTLLGLLGAVALLGATPGVARADRRNPLDPFHGPPATARLAAAASQPATPASPARAGALLAAASQPATPASPARAGALLAAASQPATPASQPASAPASQPGAADGMGPLRVSGPRACRVEADCPPSTTCEQDVCLPVQLRLNAAYFYYRSAGRSFTEVAGLYWRQSGKSGYRVLAPFYWHFWTPTQKVRAVAPFYWHAEDHQTRESSTVVPPLQWGSAPGETYFRFWPIVFYRDFAAEGKSLTVVPLFHAARRGTHTALFTPLGGYASDPTTGEKRGLALLYYWHRSQESRADALVPLFYASRGREHATALALPLSIYWRRGDHSHLVSVPFAYYGSDRISSMTIIPAPPIVSYRHLDYRFTTVFPLFWRFGTPQDRQTWLLPLAFRGRSDGGGHLVVFPLLWHFSGKKWHTTVVANSWYHRHEHGYSGAFLPLVYFGADRKEGVSYTTVLPFFHRSTEDHGRHTFLLTPIGIHENDRDAATSYTWILNYYRRRDPEREIDTFVPLYLRWRNIGSGSTVQAITPLVWLHSGLDGGTKVLFPAIWRFTSARSHASATIVFPLAFRHSSPHGSTTVLGPAYYHRDREGWDAGLAPLLFAGRGADSRYAVLFPAIWHLKHGAAATTIAGPIFHRTDERGWDAGLAPLLFVGHRGGERHFVLFPLLWHFSDAAQASSTTVVGPAYVGRRRDGYQAGLAPFLFFGKSATREHQIVAPLFFRFFDARSDTETLVIGPAYRHVVGSRSRQLGVFPLVDYVRTTAPVDTTELTVIPVLRHVRRPGYALWLTPLGGRLTRGPEGKDTLVLGPYIRYRSPHIDAHAVAPLYARWRDARDGSQTTLAVPLGVYRRAPNDVQAVLFPFIWYFKNQRETDLTVFPFYGRVRSGDLDADIAFPLVWSFRSATRRTHVVAPGWVSWGLKAQSVNLGVAPLFMYRRDPSRWSLTALPIFHYERNYNTERTSLLVAGPFIRATYKDGYMGALLPIAYLRDRGPQRTAALFPILWHRSDAKEDVHTSVLLPFLYRRNGSARTYGILPLIYARSFPHGGSFTAIPALQVSVGPEHVRVLTPAAGLHYGRGPNATWGYLGPIWFKRSINSSNDGLAPIYWRFHDLDKDRRTFALFPLWYSQSQPDRSFHAAFPLVWHSRAIGVETTVVLPVFFDVNRFYQERTTVIFPLAIRRATGEDQTTRWWSLPTVFVRHRPEATDAFVFPLLWHWGGSERSTTVLAPLYLDVKRGGDRSTVLFPLVWRFARGDASHWVVLNSYLKVGRGKEAGTYRYIFVPLFEIGRPRPNDLSWDVLGGLVGYSRIGRNRVLRLAWQDIWLTPRRVQPPAAKPPVPKAGLDRAPKAAFAR